MYIINDIELLLRLYNYKILTLITNECEIGVTGIRLSDYSLKHRLDIEKIEQIKILEIDDEFINWANERRNTLSISDLSSMYFTLNNAEATLLVSDEDKILEFEAKKININYLRFNQLVNNLKEDNKIVQFYNLLKAV